MPKKGDYNYPQLWDREWLYQKYWVEEKIIREIADEIGCSYSAVHYALKRTNVSRRSVSEAKSNPSEETKRKIKENHADFKGVNHPMYGKHCSEETKRKISKAHKGKDYISKEVKQRLSAMYIGENNPNWRGGASFEPYCHKFNKVFKEYIRDKFGRKCFICGKTEKENGKKLNIHHVNYSKKCLCDEDTNCQFVPLCSKCHSKTNHNREYWEREITTKLHETINGWFI